METMSPQETDWEEKSNRLRRVRKPDDTDTFWKPSGSESRGRGYSPESDVTRDLPAQGKNGRGSSKDDPRVLLKNLLKKQQAKLSVLKDKRAEIDEQRQENERRIRESSDRPQDMSVLLAEMRRQEENNRRAIDQLKQQLLYMQSTSSWFHPSSGSLAEEIRLLRENYIQHGGQEADILRQMSELEVQALSTARSGKRGDTPKADAGVNSMQSRLAALETENERLERELERTQESRRQEELQLLSQRHQDQTERLGKLEQEMELMKLQGNLEQERTRMSYPPSGPVLEPPRQWKVSAGDIDPLLPSPYDENAGFVIFYDYILGLNATSRTSRLVVSLYDHQGQCGQPTYLNSIQCVPQPGSYGPYPAQVAIIGAKQAVPRLPVSHRTGLLLELQTGASDADHLVSRAWTKMDLFSRDGVLRSGRWRLPLILTPVRPGMPEEELAHLPQFAAAELYLRLVNARDSVSQCEAVVTPQNALLYKYLPQNSLTAPNEIPYPKYPQEDYSGYGAQSTHRRI